MGKSLFASKTFWFNVLSSAVGLAGVVPPPWGLLVAGVGNVVLRVLFTDKPITSVLPQ